jgi:acetyl esterase/lipase
MGDRESVPNRIQRWVRSNGYVLVSIEYRLAPETKLPEIIGDVEDALRWIRERGPELFQADTGRIAVAGASAGGYLTLTAGYRVQPPPTVLISLYGYGDILGDWYTLPSSQPRHQHNMMTAEQAWKQPNDAPLADSRNRKGDGYGFYYFTRRQGIWPNTVSGWDPRTEPERFFPYMPVNNVRSAYPPTVMIHGTADTDVPFEQSRLMADQFRKHGVSFKLLTIPNGEHGLTGGDRQVIEDAYREAFEFADGHLR